MTVDDSFLTIPSRIPKSGSAATLDLSSRSFRHSANLSHSNPDLLESVDIDFLSLPATEAPEDLIKIYKSDQTFKFLYVNDDTTARDAVTSACKEFSITENLDEYALYRITVQQETSSVKQSKLPDAWSKLADIPLGSRYYLKKVTSSEQLFPDENTPDLIKEANFTFLDLNCFEVALYLTREDYKLFQMTEPTNFIDDLFHGDSELLHFKKFEDLVNRELFWVVTTICNEPSPLLRSKIIKHFTKIAHHCKVLKNFNSTFAVVSGLGYRAVSRLKQTWEKVPTKSVRLLKELQALMDPSRNMSKYRTLLNDYIHQPPVIPYIPVVKKDLTFLHLGNDTKVNGLINFEKMRMIAKEVRNVCRLCAPDKSQIIPSAVVSQQKEPDKGAIYQTLVRRGRRASFNNVRRIYEDQMNVRRVRQYMNQLDIVSNEEKLMELSKQIELPAASSSAQMKRRNPSVVTQSASSSPSRSSKTLPNQPGRSSSSASTNSLQSRNNSEPHLANIPGIAIQPMRKKTMSSTLPKYGNADLQSPQMISRKLMSLSEETAGGGGEDKRSRGKKMKDSKRSASVSSHEFSPASSPYMTPKHQETSKLIPSSNHTVASENTNKNNNRQSFIAPPNGDPAYSAPNNVYGGSKKSLPPHMGNSGSCRSSIASTSSLGTMSSSNPSTSSLVGNGGSPRSSSPISWGSSASLPHGVPSNSRFQHSNSPSRSASGSSADTVKSAVEVNPQHERPIIKQSRNSRSGSYGGVNSPSSMNERVLSQITGSNSSPSLSANRTQPALILPNHPRIPRTPSIDSGVLSGGSLSADSVRYNPSEENEIFGRGHPHYFPQVYHQVPMRSNAARTPENTAAANRRSQHMRSMSVDQQSSSRASQAQRAQTEDDKTEKVEQTFLSGCRGPWDTPRPDNKAPTVLPLSNAVNSTEYGKLPPDLILHPGHIPPGIKVVQGRHPGSRNVLGKSVVKGIHDFVVFERQSSKHSHPFYRNTSAYDHNPIMQPNFINSIRTTTSEDLLEEQLVQELQQQRPKYHNTKRLLHFPSEGPPNRANLKRLSFHQSDAPMEDAYMWAYSPSGARGQLPSPQTHYPPERMMVPQEQLYQHPHQFRTSPQMTRPTALTNSPKSYRGLNPTEASAIAAYDAMQYNGWTQEGDLPSPMRNCDAPNSFISSEQYFYETQKRYSGSHPSSPMTNGPIDPYYDQMQNAYPQYSSSQHSMDSSCSIYPSEVPSGYRVSRDVTDGVSHVRRRSQEWNETDLDGPNLSMKAWGSNASLPGAPVTSQLPPRALQPELLQKSAPEVKSSKASAPPPPVRTSSRTPNSKPQSGSNSPSTTPVSSTIKGEDTRTSRHSVSMDQPLHSVKANGHLPNGQVTSNTASPSNSSRRSLPSYNEALQQINAKHTFPTHSPMTNSYRNAEKHENKEQVSHV